MEQGYIKYHLIRRGQTAQTFTFKINGEKVSFEGEPIEDTPEWARLEHDQCPHCPLKVVDHPKCPVAMELSRVVGQFEHLKSYDSVTIEVSSDERNVLHTTSAQRALCSLLGLLIANSGCPHTEPFRAMSRFHLPVASDFENLYRVVSMYVTAQFFRQHDAQAPDLTLAGLKQIYMNIHAVNYWMAKRLRDSQVSEATVNAIALLDTYALYLPYSFEETMDRLSKLFEPVTSYLDYAETLPDAPDLDSLVPENLARKLETLARHNRQGTAPANKED